MGRLYSGNLNDFKAACNRLRQLDFVVIVDEFICHDSSTNVMVIRVEDRAGNIIDMVKYRHRDEDVLCNNSTRWLRRIATQLSTWSKY